MGIQETHTKGCGIIVCAMGSKSEVWEEMEGGVIWCGVYDKSKGRGKEGCAFYVSYSMGRHKGTWMKGVQDSVGSWGGRNSEACIYP